MTKKFYYLSLMALVFLSGYFFAACSKDDVEPEITVEEGFVDYFEKPIVISSDGGQEILTFRTNVSWTIDVSATAGDVSWCSVSDTSGKSGSQSITISVAKNDTYEDRTATITLTAGNIVKTASVTQRQKDAILMSPNRFDVGIEGGTIKIDVNSNINYNVIIPEQYQGWISSMSNKSMTISSYSFLISESKEYDKREGEIVFLSDNLKETVKVYQAGSAILVLSKNEVVVDDSENIVDIEISSNFKYVVDMATEEWIRIIEDKTSEKTISFSIDANNTYEDREAIIVFRDANSDKKESVTIIQRQKDAILLASKKIDIGQDGGIFSIDVNSNVDYTVEIASSCSSWISQSNLKSGSLITTSPAFEVANSEEYNVREGEIYFKYNDISDTLKVYQSGGAVLVLNQSEYYLEGGNSTISVELKSNIDFSYTISDSWISEVATRAVSSTQKTFNVDVNKTGSTRKGTILFTSSDGSKTAKVTIIQETIVLAESLKITWSGYLGYVGEKYLLYANATPSNAITDFEWSSSDDDVLSIVSSDDSQAKIKMNGFGVATVVLKDKNSGQVASLDVPAWVSGFYWKETGEEYVYGTPMMTMVVGDTQKINYDSDQGSSIKNLFANVENSNNFVLYGTNGVISSTDVVKFNNDGTVTALNTGIVGIKPTGHITGGRDRLYIKVVGSRSESEENNSIATANKYISPVELMLSSMLDQDYFEITLPYSSDPVFFNIKLESLYGYDLRGHQILVYNKDGESFGISNASNTSFSVNRWGWGGQKMYVCVAWNQKSQYDNAWMNYHKLKLSIDILDKDE